MADTPPLNLPQNDVTDTDPEFRLADVTALYVDIANRVAEHTRMNTQELTKIIAHIHQANQSA
jgi:hypothetical protein